VVHALIDASMTLRVGPVNPSDAANLFAAAYGLFSGCVFITTTRAIGALIVHRFLHSFHLRGGWEAAAAPSS
jgi:hypothetical protein